MLDALGLHDAAVAACESGLERCPGSALLRAALAPTRARAGAKLAEGPARRPELAEARPTHRNEMRATGRALL